MATTTTTTTTTAVTTTKSVAVLDDNRDMAEALIAQFAEAKAGIKALEAQKDAAEKALREMLGDCTSATIGGVERITISLRNMSKIDREALKAAFPEAYSATLVEGNYTVLLAK
jgi:hypothetical protein